MKIIRYEDEHGAVNYGRDNADGTISRLVGDLYSEHDFVVEPNAIRRRLAPVVPIQILCVGLNYRRHAQEAGAQIPDRPVLFVKGINTLQHPGGAIELPRHLPSSEVDYECELAVVIGRDCKNATAANALSFVLGYTCANDVSARDHQLRLGGGQWCRGKFFDTFAPLGPCVVTKDEIPDPQNLRISTVLNDEVVQDWTTADMIFPVAKLIEYLSGSTTLLAGTVILTGTPHGVGMAAKPMPRWLRRGDTVTIEIEGIGRLSNPVTIESD